MHILFLPSWYNSEVNPDDNNFITNQIKGVEMAGAKVGVVFVRNTIYDRSFSKLYSKKVRTFNGINEVRIETLLPSMKTSLGISVINYFWLKAYRQYCTSYGEPDIIHAHGYISAIIAKELRSKFAIPYVITEHSQDFLLKAIKPSLIEPIRRAFMESSKVISVGEELKGEIRIQLGVESEVIPNCIDVYSYKSKKEYSIVKDRPINFLILSYLLKRKKIERAIYAAKDLVDERITNFKTTIIGDGPELQTLQRLVKNLHLGNYIDYKGLVLNRDLKGAIRNYDVFILTCRTETFSVATLESLVCGLDVIIPDTGEPKNYAPAEMSKKHTNTVRSIASCMKEYIKRENTPESKLADMESFISQFSIERVGKRYHKLYETVYGNYFLTRPKK